MGFEPGKPINIKVRAPKKKATPKVKAPAPAAPPAVHVHVHITPDQADRERSPAQKKRDAQVVAQNVASSRRKVVIRQRQQDVAAIPKAVLTGGNLPSEQRKFAKEPQAQQDALKQHLVKVRAANAAKVAPVLKVLDQTTRVNHAIAGAADAVLTHKPVLKAAERGIENKDRTTFSDVLAHAGVKNKAVKGIAGFGLDVALDPTTYLTAGTGSVAAHAAEKAGQAATAKATVKGLTEEQAAKFGQRAASRAAKTADQTKGVTVKIAGAEMPGVRKATAVASKPVRKAASKVTPAKVRANTRAIGADLNPDVAPVGVSKDASSKAVQATRTARAERNRGLHEAQQQAAGIKQMVGEANYSRIIDAIEHGTIGDLSPDLRAAAVKVRSQFRYANRIRKQAGIPGGEIKARPKIKIPQVTADTGTSAKAVAKAKRAEASAQRALDDARSHADIYQGRAEVLSRNVSGSSAEKAAERGRVRRKVRATKVTAKYAAGGHGVKTTSTAVRDAERHLTNMTAARQSAESAHEAIVAQAAAERAARDSALKVNAKREVAPKGYIPHQLTEEAQAERAVGKSGVGQKVIRPSSSKARKDNRPLSELRVAAPGKYSEDLPNLYASRIAEGHASAAKAHLNRRIAALGTDVKKGHPIALKPGEAVFHIVGSDIREVPEKEAQKVIDQGGKKGRYVALHKDIVKRALEGSSPTLQGPGIVHALDKTTSGFKRIAIATPGFHVRNFIGDTQNAYLGQAGHRLPGNMRTAGKILKAEARNDKSLRSLAPPAGVKTFHTPRYGDVTYEQAAKQLGKHGAMRSGYTARELPELAKSGSETTAGKVKGRLHLPEGLKRAALNREDLPRLTTAVEALRNGSTWEGAAQKVSNQHFDYQHLTQFERQIARRAMPFYTFSARNIPLQAKTLLTHPGKYANYQKVREEFSKSTQPDKVDAQTRGMYKTLERAGVKFPGGWEKYLTTYEQRNAGIPIKAGGKKYTLSAGLPLTDLNEVPGAALGSQIDEYYQKTMSLTGPLPKDLVEYMDNHSFFFRDQLERDNSPLVAAPGWAKHLPGPIKKAAQVGPIIDKKTGKKVLGWRGKADYVFSVIPGTPQYVKQFTTQGANQQGKGMVGKALGFAGVKSVPIDPVKNATNLAYARQAEIQKQLNALRQSGVGKNNPTAEWRKLNAQLKVVGQVAYQGKAAQGYKVLPKQGGPPKPRGSSSGRVKLPSVSDRVKLPTTEARVKLPG